jgi:hypothetical protein
MKMTQSVLPKIRPGAQNMSKRGILWIPNLSVLTSRPGTA